MKLNDAPDELLIKKYVELRAARAQRKKAFEMEDSAEKGKQEKIEIEFLRRFNERGTDSTSSREYGTAYRRTTTSCTVSDWEAYLQSFVIPNASWDFLEKRANKTMVDAYRKEHDDIPPGLNWVETATVGFRSS